MDHHVHVLNVEEVVYPQVVFHLVDVKVDIDEMVVVVVVAWVVVVTDCHIH